MTQTVGAWLWSKRRGIVSGAAASAMHGAEWVEADTSIELVYNCTRPPGGIVARNERLEEDEITWAGRLPVATPARVPPSTWVGIWPAPRLSRGWMH